MKRIVNHAGWAVAGALAFALVMSIASVARGGSLDPTAPPGSTMRSLDQVIGAWDRKLDSSNGSAGTPHLPTGCDSSRFKCVFPRGIGCVPVCVATAYDGVLDLETGLVWERDPSNAIDDWVDAMRYCQNLELSGRKGWRLPTLPELASLPDSDTNGIPAGHPFDGVVQVEYYSSTNDPGTPDSALTQLLTGGQASVPKFDGHGIWCVRGPTNHANG